VSAASHGTDLRLPALRRFATGITVLNICGHAFLGFEQALATPVVALVVAYASETLLETVEAWRVGRPPRYRGGLRAVVDFLLSAHITALAVSMLLYAGDRLAPIAFGTAVAIASKYLVSFDVAGRRRHVFNPSNLGITLTLLLFPSVGVAQPYMFTENISGGWDWFVPVVVVLVGSLLNWRFTRRLPLIAAWLSAFVLQAALRHLLFGGLFVPALNPMTGVAFLLFTFYMVTDPATTPSSVRGQIAFGASVALLYGTIVVAHVVFGLFFALSLTCAFRGGWLFLQELRRVPETAGDGATGGVRALNAQP